MMMLECWEYSSENRPSFKTLSSNTSKMTEGIAGYLEVGFNLFALQKSTKDDFVAVVEEVETEEIEPPIAIQVIPPSLETEDNFPE